MEWQHCKAAAYWCLGQAFLAVQIRIKQSKVAYTMSLPLASVAQPQVGEVLLPPASHDDIA